MSDDLIGVVIDGCQVEALLGAGGMARVYRATQSHLGRVVALKVVPPIYQYDTNFADRFQREALMMARLTHPNIVTLYDAGRVGALLYIVMEFIGGGTLRDRMVQPMPIVEAAALIRDVIEALSFAHAHKVIHRDVKPSNVLIDLGLTPGAPPRAKLTDFGIAKLLDNTPHLTKTGAGVGTPEYMSPEQCQGVAVDARADIYALGVLLYEVMCGRPPFIAEEFTALAHAHRYEPPPPPTLFNPTLSPALQTVMLRALAKRPADRFQSARAMADALDAAIGQEAGPTIAPQGMRRIECPRCGQSNASALRFCSRCGLALRGDHAAVAISCPNCQAPNPGVNHFCFRCGARLPTLSCDTCGRASPPEQRYCVHCGQPLRG